ncbi:RHS repeat-associated protein [Frondihabitans sp. PhB188]|nr:RHS repeat-associated protein [Frondihabitans sp. PhB188]
MHYTAFGQQDSSTSTADDGTSVVANLTYNTANSITDGTVATATAPGNTNNPTTYGYNTDHQLTSITPVTGSSLQAKAFTYDWFGRLATQTDGAGNTTSYTYDNNDRLLTTSFSDSTPTVTDTYDAGGHLLTEASGPGTVTSTYDQLGRLTSTVNTAGGGTISYGFDKASNETSMTTSYGTWTNTFDASGVLLVTKYPKGSTYQYTDYATDSQGRRTDTFLQGNSTYTNSTTSTPNYPTSYTARYTTTYDANGRIGEVKAITNGSTPSTTFDTQYCYNSASTTSCLGGDANKSTDHSKVYWSKDLTPGGSLTVYKYTTAGRVKSATETGGTSNTVWTYTYDNRGNRLTAKTTVDGGTPTTQTLTYNAANQISSAGYVHDGAGNLTATPTATYTYNAAEQMTSSTKTSTGVTTTYTYAGAAQNAVLSESTAGGYTYNLTYGQKDSNGQPEIVKYNTHTAQNDLTGNLFADPTTGQPAMLTTSSDIGCLYVYDGLGNPVGLLTDFATNAISTNYDPYGVGDLSGTGNGVGQNPYTFHSGTQDRASGLIKFGIRWYNPATGTWTQQDTLDAPLDPANANRYVFVGGDPVNGLDPTGKAGGECAGAIIAEAAGVAVLGIGVGLLVAGASTGATEAIAAGTLSEEFVVGGAAGGAVGTILGGFTSTFGIGDIQKAC